MEHLLTDKSVRWIQTLLLAWCLALPGILPASDKGRDISLVAGIWPPYVDAKLLHNGLAISLVTAVLERAGYTPHIMIESWQEVLDDVSAVNYDGSAVLWKNDEREQLFEFSDPYLTNDIKFLKRRGTDYTFDSLADLKGLRVGIVYGYRYGAGFDSATGFDKVPEYHIVPNLLELAAGRIDLTLGDERTLHYEIGRHMTDQKNELLYLSRPLASRELSIAVHRSIPDSDKIILDFNKALSVMRQDGSYQALVREFNTYIWMKDYLPD